MRRAFVINIRRKVTWGAKTVLSSLLLLTLAFIAPPSLDAAQNTRGGLKAEERLTKAERQAPKQAEPRAEQHLALAERKLDGELRKKSAQSAGETAVIVELTDNSAEDVAFGDDTSELEGFDSSIWDSLFELTTDDPIGDGTPPPTEPAVETVTTTEPVEPTGPTSNTAITPVLEGGLL